MKSAIPLLKKNPTKSAILDIGFLLICLTKWSDLNCMLKLTTLAINEGTSLFTPPLIYIRKNLELYLLNVQVDRYAWFHVCLGLP